jgi:serine/threonine protein kinase
VDGDDIARLLRRCGALPADAAREITADLVLALEHAHARGVVHRDIKASNVLLERSGRARLIDFNLASA